MKKTKLRKKGAEKMVQRELAPGKTRLDIFFFWVKKEPQKGREVPRGAVFGKKGGQQKRDEGKNLHLLRAA